MVSPPGRDVRLPHCTPCDAVEEARPAGHSASDAALIMPVPDNRMEVPRRMPEAIELTRWPGNRGRSRSRRSAARFTASRIARRRVAAANLSATPWNSRSSSRRCAGHSPRTITSPSSSTTHFRTSRPDARRRCWITSARPECSSTPSPSCRRPVRPGVDRRACPTSSPTCPPRPTTRPTGRSSRTSPPPRAGGACT